MRRRAAPCSLLRHAHEPGDGKISSGKKAIGRTGHGDPLRAPADDIRVKGLGRIHICRHQLIPDEPAMNSTMPATPREPAKTPRDQ